MTEVCTANNGNVNMFYITSNYLFKTSVKYFKDINESEHMFIMNDRKF
jgi:hypothetical protein